MVLMKFVKIIKKGNEEVKLTSDVHNQLPSELIYREVGCVHYDVCVSSTVHLYV